ncbi:Espin [Carex littledalei]|uniref:Espin n=1 Tax=Carex littledalei TaxID=544730 RepID=A0A833RIW3_9POAL|nr:Espin [Carex littledalei]
MDRLLPARKRPLRKEAKLLATKPWYREFFQTTLVGSLPLLHHAASQGAEFLCELLIGELHIDVNSRDSHGATALHYAVLENHTVIIGKLLQNFGADINARDLGDLTPLVLSIMMAKNPVMLMLVGGSSIDEETCFGRAVHAAAFTNNPEAVHACSERGADIDHVLNGFYNPLVAAVFGSSLDCVLQLLHEFSPISQVSKLDPGSYTIEV